ncbi:hypothetical protein CL629_04425 [bacterium]|nr:hypothetical protein [bacterium]|tara:strand:- start:9845 stop:10237 length:393 start_codon:yes stop_codon:yes gene_type:complete
MRTITEKGKVIALVFDNNLEKDTVPLTPEELPLQVIGLNYPKGKVWPLHIHEPKKRVTEYGLEAFFILQGKARIQIFKDEKETASFELKSSEGVMVLDGAIKIEVLEDLKALEFKNGPFIKDKVILHEAS